MLGYLVGRYGLTDPEHFTWTLRNRSLPPQAQCPAYVYSVIKRNFDPITWQPSSYVNGNLYTYQIIELCPAQSIASAEEVLVDPLGTPASSVASWNAFVGDFYRGLTRDDMGGIRYLLSTNNINWETTPPDAFIFATNKTAQLLYSSNLQVFAEQSLTNDAAALQALWPGLVVTGTSNFFVNVVETNTVAYFTNPPYAPVGSPPTLVFATNYTVGVATRYVHTFGNVLTNQVYNYCVSSLLTTNIAPSPYALPGSGISTTNVTLQTYLQPGCVSGSFFILPTNVCAYHILSTQLTQVVTFTNFLTNTFTSTTYSTASNSFDYYEFSQSIVTYFTNSIYVAWPVSCPDEITTLFEGIEKITFVRRDFDSLLGQFFQPASNSFSLIEITNNTRVSRKLERIVTAPDILVTAGDETSGGTTYPPVFPLATITEPDFQTPTRNQSGPGTIVPGVVYSFNKVGPFVENSGPNFITETAGFQGWRWGSFDGSTNAPIVYPVGTDLQSLENSVLINLTQPSTVTNGAYLLPDGRIGDPYQGAGYQLMVIGGTPLYSWDSSAAILPGGLMVSSAGLISGTPAIPGIYDFTIRMTDSAARFVDYAFTMTIQP
jgi:hypothetical protein